MRLIVNGCAGRMGRTLIKLIDEQDGVELAGGLEAADSAALGEDLGVLAGGEKLGLSASDDALTLMRQADGVIDFTTPPPVLSWPHWPRKRALSILSARPVLTLTKKRKSPRRRAMRALSNRAI